MSFLVLLFLLCGPGATLGSQSPNSVQGPGTPSSLDFPDVVYAAKDEELDDGRPTGFQRPEALLEPWPQGKLLRHASVGYEIVQSLDVPVPQMEEPLPNIVQFFAEQLPVVAEQGIEVPKILPHDVPPRRWCRDTQLVEQLVEVPTPVSYSSLLQRTVEQHVDIPVPVGGGRNAVLQGFVPEQSSTTTFSSAERISERIMEQIVDFPVAGGGLH